MNSNDKKILIIDIETTGFLKEGGSIVEIAAVELNLDNGLMYVVFDSICRESILNANHRNAWVFNNSDLTVEMVMEAPKFEEVSRMFQEVVMQYPFGSTSYNKIFDFTFLQDRGLKFPKILPCPMLLSTDILKLPGKYGNYKWPSVEEAFHYFFPDEPYKEKHRAGDDAFHEAMIVYKLYSIGVFNTELC